MKGNFQLTINKKKELKNQYIIKEYLIPDIIKYFPSGVYLIWFVETGNFKS